MIDLYIFYLVNYKINCGYRSCTHTRSLTHTTKVVDKNRFEKTHTHTRRHIASAAIDNERKLKMVAYLRFCCAASSWRLRVLLLLSLSLLLSASLATLASAAAEASHCCRCWCSCCCCCADYLPVLLLLPLLLLLLSFAACCEQLLSQRHLLPTAHHDAHYARSGYRWLGGY